MCTIKGQIIAYFEDISLYEKYVESKEETNKRIYEVLMELSKDPEVQIEWVHKK